jgi:SWI/SNF-related matrix-associated actin-dependent regulator 1 of chromatin subfamily A
MLMHFGDKGYNPVALVGGMNDSTKQLAVDTFQNDPSCRLFIGNIQAAGEGITLTAASHVIFVELDWAPSQMSQCEDRCHRIGQKDNVLVQHLVFENSIDAKIAKVLLKKQKIISSAIDGTTSGAVDWLSELTSH